MTGAADGDDSLPITLAFVGHTTDDLAPGATAFEDAVLPLLGDHGARVVYRGRRLDGQDATLPLEVHVLWFPDRAAYEAYLADDRRAALLARFGDVFTQKQAVELETLVAGTLPAR